MNQRSLLRLGLVLSVVAVGLAFTAVLIGYFRHGEIRWPAIGGGAICGFSAFSAWEQLRRGA